MTEAEQKRQDDIKSDSRHVIVGHPSEPDVQHMTIQIQEQWGSVETGYTPHLTEFYFTGSREALRDLSRLLERR